MSRVARNRSTYPKKIDKKKTETKSEILKWTGRLIIAAVIVLLLFIFVIGSSAVSGHSMYPTYKDGQQVMYIKLGSNYESGEVAVIKMVDGTEYIKRVIGTPGDTIDIKDGKVYINGEAEDGDYINGETEPDTTVAEVSYPLTLGENEYFVLGDNRADSVDSRTFGTIVGLQFRGHVVG